MNIIHMIKENKLKKLAIMAILAMVMVSGFACSSKTVVEEVYEPEVVDVERG